MTNNETRYGLITGAGQGLGREIALQFASAGITPVLVGRTRAKLEAVAQEIAPVQPIIIELDVTDAAAIAALPAQLPSLDILINCAGEAFIRPMDETNDAEWARIIDVNLTAPFRFSRALLPLLRQSPNASILNILSKVATGGFGGVSAYSAAKTGLLGFTHSLAAELRPEEIRVVAVCPGPMDTPMRWAATPDYDPKLLVQPRDVAAAILHVVTLPRRATTGDVIVESMWINE